jgi:hypothetical protein
VMQIFGALFVAWLCAMLMLVFGLIAVDELASFAAFMRRRHRYPFRDYRPNRTRQIRHRERQRPKRRRHLRMVIPHHAHLPHQRRMRCQFLRAMGLAHYERSPSPTTKETLDRIDWPELDLK